MGDPSIVGGPGVPRPLSLEDLRPLTQATPLRHTPLIGLHRELGGKIVPFAGYELPVQYPAGIVAEHQHCRTQAVLFDVSHMGQVTLAGPDAAAALEALVPGDIAGLKSGQMRYTQFTDREGGILDDLMVTRVEDGLLLVVNAACKANDLAHLRENLEPRLKVTELADRALIALQGPAAATALARLVPAAATLGFMTATQLVLAGTDCWVSRSGYTGEDGFEISVPADQAERIARLLLAEPEVKPAGLGARDSLRLEAGLCLYGHDIDRTTTPIEAGLAWSIGKRRRAEGGFPGAGRILEELAKGTARRRIGIRPEGRVIARENTPVLDEGGARVGTVTSGGFGPSFGGPVAMGYVSTALGAGAAVGLLVRDQKRPAQLAKLPFVPQRYYRGPAGPKA